MAETSALQSGYDVVLNKATTTKEVLYTSQSGVDIVVDQITTTIKPKRYTIELGTGGSTGSAGSNLQSGVWTYLDSFGDLNTVADKQGYISFVIDNAKPWKCRVVISRYDIKGVDHTAGLHRLKAADNCYVEWEPEEGATPQASRFLVRGEVEEHGNGDDLYLSFRCASPEGSLLPTTLTIPDEGTDILVALDYTFSWPRSSFFVGKGTDFPTPGVAFVNADPMVKPGDVSAIDVSKFDLTGHEFELGQIKPDTKLFFVKTNGSIAVEMTATGYPAAQTQAVHPFDKSYRIPVAVDACLVWWNGTAIAKLQIGVESTDSGGDGGGDGGGTGTLILDGDVPPEDFVGELDNYYFDKHDHVLYGPKKLPTVAYPEPVALLENQFFMEMAFGAGVDDVELGGGVGTVGSEIQYTAPGQIIALRFFSITYEAFGEDPALHPPLTDPVTLTLWDEDANLVATVTAERIAVGWVSVPLETPIDVVAGQKFRVGLDVAPDDTWGMVYNFITKYFAPPEEFVYLSYGNMTSISLCTTTDGIPGYPSELVTMYPEEGESFSPFHPFVASVDTVFSSDFIPTTLFTTHNKPMDDAYGLDGESYGNRIRFTADGQVTGLRHFYFPTYFNPEVPQPADLTMSLWSDNGTLLATASLHCEQIFTWYEATLDTPVNVMSGQVVRVAINIVEDQSVGILGDIFNEEAMAMGITMENAHMEAISGCFFDPEDYDYYDPGFYGVYGIGPFGYPAKLAPELFMVDMVFSTAVGPWPIALISGGDFVPPEIETGPPPEPPFEPWVRTQGSYAAGSLAAGASSSSSVYLGLGYRLLRIGIGAPARIRFYTTTAKRNADVSRPIGVDPVGDHGCILDFVATGSVLEKDLIPAVDGYDGNDYPDGNIPINITNLDTATQYMQFEMTWIRTE